MPAYDVNKQFHDTTMNFEIEKLIKEENQIDDDISENNSSAYESFSESLSEIRAQQKSFI